MAAKNSTPSLSERKAAAGLPLKSTTAAIAKMGLVTYIAAEAATARNPQTGEMGDGFYVTVEDSGGQRHQAFVGGVVLQRDLQSMIDTGGFPFKARLVRTGEGQGKPWTFAD